MNPKHLPMNGDNTKDLTDESGAARQPAEKLLTPREVAAWLDVSLDWVQNHATGKEPRIPLIRVGKLLRFRRKDIELFIANQLERRKPAFTRGLGMAQWGKRASGCA